MTQALSFRRLGFTFAAQIYNQIVTIGIQLILVPVLLYAWGTDRYGGWLVLSAIPTCLNLSDFGFTLVAKNEMVIRSTRGDRDGALVTYHSVLALLIGSAAALLIPIALIVESTPLDQVLAIGPIPDQAAKTALLALVASVISTQFFLLLCAGIRTAGRPAAEVTWGATARLAEGIATAVTAMVSSDVRFAALAILFTRLFFVATAWLWLKCLAPHLPLGLGKARLSEVRRLLNPSLSFMLMSLAQALVIQGPVVVLGMVGLPTDVVVFSTSRTLARTGTSAANLVNFSLAPEYSRLFGAGDFAGFLRLEKIHLAVGAIGVTAYTAALALCGAWVMGAWTHGNVHAVYPFFALLNAAVAAEMIWGALFTSMAAINRHVAMSYTFVSLSILGILLCYPAARFSGLTGVAMILLGIHVIMTFAAVVFVNPFQIPEVIASASDVKGKTLSNYLTVFLLLASLPLLSKLSA